MKFCASGIVLTALCVGSSALAQSTQAVEWKVSDGGNGHWYQLVYTGSPISFQLARSSAQGMGADLAVINSSAANTWIFDHLVDNPAIWFSSGGVARHGPWIGLMQLATAPDFRDPGGGWYWVNGTPATYVNWAASNDPCETQPARDACVAGGTWFAHYYCPLFGSQPGGCNAPTDTWGAAPNSYFAQISFIQEWSADCNGDGIVDYGQIKRGELDDDNANGIPDICEASVTGVIPPSVPSQGGSTITIKGANFPESPTVLIGGVPAMDVVRLSATRITATSPALLPGMTSIQVNDFTLQDAIYIRPECGSDLDQNGIVDAGDISIILLDFGSCYETPLAAPTPDVPPLLEAQPLGEAPKRK